MPLMVPKTFLLAKVLFIKINKSADYILNKKQRKSKELFHRYGMYWIKDRKQRKNHILQTTNNQYYTNFIQK